MKAVYSFLFVFLGLNTFAQDSLLDELDNISDSLNVEEGDTLQESSKKKEIVYGTFIGNRLINGQSSEMLGKNVFEFNIAHRFGRVNEGWRNFFGLDQASMRIGLQYGILDQLSVGVGRSTYLKTFDLYAKGKLLEQKKHGMPITAVAFAEIAFDTRKNLYPDARPTFFSQRISYTGQLIIARKFCEWFSFQVVPTVVHYNLVETKADKNTLFSVGLGSSSNEFFWWPFFECSKNDNCRATHIKSATHYSTQKTKRNTIPIFFQNNIAFVKNFENRNKNNNSSQTQS